MASRDENEIEDVTPKPKKTLKTYLAQGTFLVLMTAGVAGFVLGDMGQYMGGSSGSSIASVGSKEIGIREADQMRQNVMAQYKGMPPELLGLQNPSAKAVEMLIEQYALSEYARDLNMRAPKQEISRILNQYNFFKDNITGKFSAEKLRLYLKRSGISQEYFLNTIEDDVLREIMFNALRSDMHIPQNMIDLVASYQNEKRKITFASVGSDYFKSLPKLEKDETAQKEFFENNKTNSLFLVPEIRDVEYVVFSPESLTDIAPSKEIVQAYYTKNIQQYKTDETRKVLQLFFDTEEAANKAIEKLEKGNNFIPSAIDLGFEMENMDLGTITRVSLDKSITDQIFAVKKGEFTQPISNGFGYVIYFSEDVTPSKTRPFENVKEDIQKTLLQEAFKEFAENNSDSLEDDIAGGMTLSEIADKYNTKLKKHKNMTHQGADYQTKEILLNNSELLANFFEAALDDEALYVPLSGGGFIYGRAVNIMPKRMMNFDEAQPLLADLYQTQMLKTELTKLNKNISKDMKEGISFAEIVKKHKLSAETEIFSRWQSVPALPMVLMSRLFDAEKDQLLKSDFTDNISDSLTLASVEEVKKETPTPEELEKVENQIRDNLRNSLYKTLVKHAKDTVGVEINLESYNRFIALNGQ